MTWATAQYAFTVQFKIMFTIREARVVLFSVASVCLSVCLSTPEPLEISNFQGIILVERADKFENGAGGVKTSV